MISKARLLTLGRVKRTGTCWIWRGSLNSMGYARLHMAGKYHRISRLVYRMWHGPLRDDEVVRHTCDNPACIRPSHLVKGTQKQNVYDAIKRRRFGKITQEQFEEIRKSNYDQFYLARKYGITEGYVRLIKRGVFTRIH